ncbi:uncharacterized protein STEHIDRAFT_123382 [Stereum hirsutum FP-91666 SS1]|uniref:uncharacterized protein n=1 Tax=Stereum hirsutum (strain FP-91666) TaxID=721885 RepID=UPI000444A90E|nr:uncharacterized protein STEHIDRAFT_123382 [Stereum hirsutum FP-91666 SS1]EIM83786.1 hypothetical protein STEHIDRAFT_123382 [Stereum hirsutum FP-91666 SS1]
MRMGHAEGERECPSCSHRIYAMAARGHVISCPEISTSPLTLPHPTANPHCLPHQPRVPHHHHEYCCWQTKCEAFEHPGRPDLDGLRHVVQGFVKACCRPELEIEGGDEIGGQREVGFSRPRTDKMQQERRREKKEPKDIDEAKKATAKDNEDKADADRECECRS